MDDVVRGHDKSHRAVLGNVQVVIHMAVRIGEAPAPFLCRHLDFVAVVGRLAHVEIAHEPPEEDRPTKFRE